MHPYLPHLLSDIAAAHQKETDEKPPLDDDAKDDGFAAYIEEVERYVSSEEPPHTFGYHCNLKIEDFPPSEQLCDDDLEKVCTAFQQMMFTYNLSVSLPENLPLPFAYNLTVDLLNEKTDIPTIGFITFDFCTGSAPDCILKAYCPCLKYCDEKA